jgi:hypothetical protein
VDQYGVVLENALSKHGVFRSLVTFGQLAKEALYRIEILGERS